MAAGVNMTMAFLAYQLGADLEKPVINQTGLTGGYDFRLVPDDPGNLDLVSAVMRVVDRLGLKLKRGKAPVETIVIGKVAQPTGN